MWITAGVRTDTIPMLANLCSKECEQNLPKPPENYFQFPHKGGGDLVQPPNEHEIWEIEMAEREKAVKENANKKELTKQNSAESEKLNLDIFKLPIIKLVWKIWEK